MSTYLFNSAIKSMPKGWKVTTMTSTPNAWTRSSWTIVQSVLAFIFLKVWLYIFNCLSLFIHLIIYVFIFASDIIFIIYTWTKKRRQLGHCFSQSGHPFLSTSVLWKPEMPCLFCLPPVWGRNQSKLGVMWKLSLLNMHVIGQQLNVRTNQTAGMKGQNPRPRLVCRGSNGRQSHRRQRFPLERNTTGKGHMREEVHTGPHYTAILSGVITPYFRQLHIPRQRWLNDSRRFNSPGSTAVLQNKFLLFCPQQETERERKRDVWEFISAALVSSTC